MSADSIARDHDLDAGRGDVESGHTGFDADHGQNPESGHTLKDETNVLTLKYEKYLYDARKGFMRRVYGVVTMQVLLTVLVSAVGMFATGVRVFLVQHATFMQLFSLIPSLVLLFCLFRYKDSYPTNFSLLFAYTLTTSLSIATVCAVYAAGGLGRVVLSACSLTLVIFVLLSIFTLQSKIDFSILASALFTCLFILLAWSFANIIFGWHDSFLYGSFGALVFSLFIIFDTYRLSSLYGVDDYIVAAVELYLDIVNLFLHILMLLKSKD